MNSANKFLHSLLFPVSGWPRSHYFQISFPSQQIKINITLGINRSQPSHIGPSDKTKMKLESISFLSKLTLCHVTFTHRIFSVLSFAIAVSSFNHGRSELDSSAMRRLLISEFRDQVTQVEASKIEINSLQMNQANLGGYRNFATQKREHSNSNTRSVIPYPRIGKRSRDMPLY